MTLLQRTGRWAVDHVIMMLAIIVLLYMFLPIFFVVLMSFNDPSGKLTYEFDGFSLTPLSATLASVSRLGTCPSATAVSGEVGLCMSSGDD